MLFHSTVYQLIKEVTQPSYNDTSCPYWYIKVNGL